MNAHNTHSWTQCTAIVWQIIYSDFTMTIIQFCNIVRVSLLVMDRWGYGDLQNKMGKICSHIWFLSHWHIWHYTLNMWHSKDMQTNLQTQNHLKCSGNWRVQNRSLQKLPVSHVPYLASNSHKFAIYCKPTHFCYVKF